MPIYTVEGPDGRIYEVEGPEGASNAQVIAAVRRQIATQPPAAQPRSGLLAAAGKGLESLIGAGTTAASATFGSPEEAARAALARQKQLEEKYADQVSLEKVKEAYEKRGLLPAAGEVLSQIPYALAEQAPNLAATIGGAKLGAMAGTAVAPGVGSALGALIGGGLGAFAPSFIQQYGGNIERQAAEQEKAGKPLDISRTAAAVAAGPQAALDVAATFIPLGRTVAGKVLGPEVKTLLERGQKEAAEKLAKESLGKTLAKGTLIGGAAEIPTEITQQVLERAQAGLSLTDDDALKEYGETAYQVGLLAPLGAAGRFTDRSAARQRLAAEEQAKTAEERKAAAAAEEARKKSPKYLLDLDTDYQAAVERMKELQAAVPKRPAKDALPEEQMAYKAAVDARNAHLKEVLQPLAAEYVPRKAEIAQAKERRRVEGMSPEDYADYAYEQRIKAAQAALQTQRKPAVEEEERLSADFADIAPPLPPKVTPELRYVQDRIRLAQSQVQGELEPTDIAEYLLQDPAMARRLVNTKPNIPSLTAKQNTTVYKKLDALLKQQTQQQAEDIEAEGLKAREFTYEEQALEDARRLREEAAFADEERMREEEAMAVEPVRKEEAVISPEREAQIKALDTARKRYLAAAETYQKAKGTPDGARALQQLLAARKEYDSFSTTPLGTQAPRPVLSPETEAQLDKALTEMAGAAPTSLEALEARIQRLADTRKTAIAKVSENASELAQYERLTQYMGTPQGLSEIARTPEMAEAAKRRMAPMLQQAQASRNEAIAAAIQEIRLQRDASGLAPLDKSDADLQNEFREKLNKDLQQAKGKAKVDDKKRQEAIAQQLQRINARIQQLESGDRAGRLLGYASAFRSAPERVGELNRLYTAYRNLSTQQGLTPQAAQLNRTLQNLVDFYTVGSGAAKPRVVAKGPREARRELVLGERTFTGYEPTVEGTEVQYQKPRKIAEYQATPEEQALVEDMRSRELAELNEAADRQYTPETSDRVKKQIFDALRARIDGFNAPATQEEVDAARAQTAPQDQATGDLFAAATERAQAEFQAAGERRTAARSELGRAMAGMRGKSAIMDQAQRLAEKFGKDLGLEGTFAAAKQRLTQAQAAKRAAETEFTEKEQAVLRAAADDALIAQRDAEAANRAANNTVDAIKARLEAEKETPTVEVRTPPRAAVLLRKIVQLQALIGEQRTNVVSGDKVGTAFAPVTDVGSVKAALDQALRAVREGETWASDIEQVQAHMATLEKYLSRREAQGRLLPQAELMAKEWYRKLAAHEVALRRPMYGAGQLTPAEIRDYTQRRLEMAQAEYDRIKLQIDGLHRQLLDTEVAVAKREVDRIAGEINALVSRVERREGADLANQELNALTTQHKDAVAKLDEAQKTFEERKKAESVPFTRKSPASALEQWMKGAQDRFEQSVQRFKDKQKALERQTVAPAATPATTAAERRAEVLREAAAKSDAPRLQDQLDAALRAQKKMKNRGSKQQRAALAEKIASLREQIRRLSGESTFGTEYYEEVAKEQAAQEAREETEAREAGKEETTRAGRRKAAKEIFGVQRTIAETGEIPQATKDGNKLDSIIKNNRQAFEMAVEQGFKSTAIRPQKRGKSATPERLMRTPLEGIAYRLRQEIIEKLEAPQTKKQTQELNKLREHLYGLEEAINTAPVTVEERRRTARAIWAKLPKDMRNNLVDTFNGRLPSGGISTAFFDRFADALETTVIRQRLGQPISQAPVTTMTKAELAPIQAETEKRVAATMKATEELRQKYYEQKEKELTEQAKLKGEIDAITQQRIEKEANEFADRVMQRFKEEEAREATRRMTEPMRGKPATEKTDNFLPARGVEVESPDLAADQVKALEDNDVAQALALLSTDKSADPVHRAVAQRLAQLLDATDVEVRDTLTDSEGNPVLGQALASGRKIRLSRAGGLTQEILLHEGTHAAAERILEAPESSLTPLQLAAKRELQALHAAIKNDPSITSTDAKASLSEFVAEVMSNRNLQQQLAKKPWRLADALKAFKSIILRLLGVKDTQSMLGAAMKSVDAIFQPTSVQTFKAEGVRTQYSQKDIAALHDGSNSMRQFAENFPQYIKQKDRTPEDVNRIGDEYLSDMFARPEDYVATAEPERLDYKSDTVMSDGNVFDPDNPLHLVEATPTTFVALQAQKNPELRKEEAFRITEERQQALKGLIRLLNSGSTVGARKKPNVYGMTATSYTLPEQALVAKAASKYGVQSTPEGRLKLVTIDPNNRHPVAVVSKEAANAIIEELRAGKNLKAAFLDGMQRVADTNAERNKTKNGWQKFDQANTEAAAIALNAGAAGTSWCTGASMVTARDQIERGDFYIYYKDGRPEVAVRMEGEDKIAEIRGNTPDQWLTPEQQDIAAEFLKTSDFEGARDFLEETEKKSTLTRIFSGKEVPGDSLVFSELINEDDTELDTHFSRHLFSFDELDGYASHLRPAPSEKTFTNLSELIDRIANKDMAEGYFIANVNFINDRGEVRYRGRTIKDIKSSDVVRAASISTNIPSPWSRKNDVLTFNRLVRVGSIYAYNSAKFPALKYVEDINVSSDYSKNLVIELANETFVDNLASMTGSAEVTVNGGYYVKVTPITVFNKNYSVLTATVTAPYVKILPLRKVLAKKPLPKVEVNTPNKIDDTPPIEELEAAAEERLLFARSNLPTAARVADQLVGQQKGWLQKLRENYLGMGGRAQFVDMRFPLEEALKKGGVEDLDAMQAMYYVRMYDQKMHFTSEAITEGVPEVVEKTRKDGRTERIIEAKAGANLTQAYKILTSKEVVKEAGSPDAANKLVTLYMAAIRGANKGYDKLNFGRAWATEEIKRLDGQINAKDTTPEERTNLQKRRKALTDRLDTMPTPEDIKASRAEIEANPVLRDAFDKVREVYNEYNRNLLNLAVQTGAISKDHARTLLAQNDYIPYYRMRGGVAEMVIGNETPIRIGNIKDNQELQELVGGDEPILDFITSSMQNTSMLVDMSLRNIAMKNAMFELRDVGLATVAKAPKSGAPKGSVTFKKDGEDYYAVVNTDALGISSDLLVKGLAGIPTMFPMWVRAMGVPARILRRAIVAAPPYWAKQVFRDSLGAAMSSGANITPVLGALRQIGKDNVLERRGITGGQVFTGLPEDKKRMLDAMQAGKVSLARGMAWLEATSAKADALTRKNQYENYLQQGLSEMEATYMALESMNFSKRGLSPSVHYANILIPFFNSQIQGLDALYKAFTGKMPMNERLAIRQKLWERGMLMFAMSMAYAWAMQDDEAYKNAKPDEKYSNWFVPLKNFGIDATLRVPIPFELGYVFKALPEAIVNSMMREEGAKEAQDAFLHIAQQTVPGGASLGMPAAVKTGLEATLGVSAYTGRSIESAQEQMLEPGYRTRDNTTELARQIGEITNFSPIKLEYLVRGYTGSMGMAALAALSAPLGGTGPEPATKRLTDTPVFGTMFQPKDASGIIDATYERLNKVNQLVKTHEDLLNKGRVADAEKYFKEHQDDMALGSLAGSFKEYMGQITKFERDIRVSNMSPDAKREKLDQARQMKIRLAESVRDTIKAAGDRKTPQASPA